MVSGLARQGRERPLTSRKPLGAILLLIALIGLIFYIGATDLSSASVDASTSAPPDPLMVLIFIVLFIAGAWWFFRKGRG
mgnify:CR=1 FL=1